MTPAPQTMGQAAPAPIPAEMLFRPPERGMPLLSPDGSSIAYLPRDLQGQLPWYLGLRAILVGIRI